MQTADNVARWFLSRNALKALSGETDFISNLKLQKLLYYAQGIYLALYDEPLFEAPIEAWQYGPVVEAVYQKYKDNGADGIKNFKNPEENFSETEESTLQFVQNAFGQFSAWKLSDMTHEESPWKNTPRNETIPLVKIQSYFKDNYIEQNC
ncbi:MAG: SocA family protein [Selenomonadaceae bacterium]|nr:SocA family protein [Selenomonadaceae bacterium]